MQATHNLRKSAEGIYESTDTEGYKEYIFKRNLKKDMNDMRTQINSISVELAELKQLLQQNIKV